MREKIINKNDGQSTIMHMLICICMYVYIYIFGDITGI